MKDPLHGWSNQIHQGDALPILSQLPDESIGLIVTSPPYNLLNSTGNGSRGHTGKWPTNKLAAGYPDHPDDMPRADYIAWQRSILTELVRILTPEGAIFYNHRPRIQAGVQESPREIFEGFHLRDEIIWSKGGGINHHPGAMTPAYEVIYQLVKSPTGFQRAPESVDYTNVWSIPRERDNDHPAPFPVELPRRCIQASTAPVILDPFIGSGSTAVAAIIERRQYVGIELNAKYCQAARLRILSAKRSLVATVPATPPSAPTIPASPVAIPTSELKPRELETWTHIAALITANQGAPIITSAPALAMQLHTYARRVERATAILQRLDLLHIRNLGIAAEYSIPVHAVLNPTPAFTHHLPSSAPTTPAPATSRSRQPRPSIANVSGVAPEVSGVAAAVSGVAAAVSGVAPQVSGVAAEVSGVAPQVSGVAAEVSGVAPEASGVAPPSVSEIPPAATPDTTRPGSR